MNGIRRLENSDRAAVHFALQSDADAIAVCSSDDSVAWEFARAAGIHSIVPAESLSVVPEFEVAWAGTGFAERFGDKYLAQWAIARSALLLFDVLTCSAPADAIRTILCDAGRGARDQLQVRGSSVLVVSNSVARPPYVSRYRRRVARHEPPLVEQITTPDGAHQPQWSPVRPRVRTANRYAELGADLRMDVAFAMQTSGAATSSQHLVREDAAMCAEQMLRYLAHHGFVRGVRAAMPQVPVTDERQMVPDVRRSVSTRSVSPSVQRRPRWVDVPRTPSRGPFWCDASETQD